MELVGESFLEAQVASQALAAKEGMTFIAAYDDPVRHCPCVCGCVYGARVCCIWMCAYYTRPPTLPASCLAGAACHAAAALLNHLGYRRKPCHAHIQPASLYCN